MSYSFSAYGKNISKIFKAVDLLARPQGATNKELASLLGLSSRSVFRLLSTLSDLGFPLTDERDSFRGETRHFLLESFVKKLPEPLDAPGVAHPSRIPSPLLLARSGLDFRRQ